MKKKHAYAIEFAPRLMPVNDNAERDWTRLPARYVSEVGAAIKADWLTVDHDGRYEYRVVKVAS